MPYKAISELPEGPRHVLPKHAQEIYLAAFNSAYEEYKQPEDRKDDTDREEIAHKVAWNAVKMKYYKSDDGKWRAKSMAG